jgi:hypothetical protein
MFGMGQKKSRLMNRMESDLSGNNPYKWSYMARSYVNDPLAINLTTGHTMLVFDNAELNTYIQAKKPLSLEFVEGKLYILTKLNDFFTKLYETGNQPQPKYLLKTIEVLIEEAMFEKEEANN